MPGRITLRRSCQACIKSKRKCDLQTPLCGRCKSRRLRCVFDNEPLTSIDDSKPTTTASTASVQTTESLSTWLLLSPPESEDTEPDEERSPLEEDADLDRPLREQKLLQRQQKAIANGTPSVDNPALHFVRPAPVPMFMTLDDATCRYLLQTLRTFPASFADQGKSLFIHPRLMRDMPVNRVAEKIFNLCKRATRLRSSADRLALTHDLDLRVQELINHTHREKPGTQGLLSAVQALILAQITLHLGALSTRGVGSETLSQRTRELKLLGAWSYRLWTSAPWTLPNASNTKQSWLFAESVRRTLLVSHLLTDTLAVLCTGSFKFTGFVATLPYDSRTDFWEDPEGPPAGLEVDCLSGTTSTLLSFRQLVIMFEDGLLTSKDVGNFERMLLVACRGYRMVMNRIGMQAYPTIDQ